LGEAWRVIGLPAVKADQIWVVKNGKKREKFKLIENSFTSQLVGIKALEKDNSEGEPELIQCPWEISFI
jgi:hypothetical protein